MKFTEIGKDFTIMNEILQHLMITNRQICPISFNSSLFCCFRDFNLNNFRRISFKIKKNWNKHWKKNWIMPQQTYNVLHPWSNWMKRGSFLGSSVTRNLKKPILRKVAKAIAKPKNVKISASKLTFKVQNSYIKPSLKPK